VAARVTNLLLTGRPGVGKTTVIQKVAARLEGRRISGFLTEEIRDRAARRTGFRAIPFGGGSITIADVARSDPPRVSKYGVDVEAIDRLADQLLERDHADLYLIDEIGKMECLSDRFVEAVERLLDSPTPVVATIGQRGGGLIARAKERPDAEQWTVTESNRDEMPGRVAVWLDRPPS
jgi:nucleoside-triphosphatase